MRIVYWGDYACPFCYIGITRLNRLIQSRGMEVELEMKSFRLDPHAPIHSTKTTVERYMERYKIPHLDAIKNIEAMSNQAKTDGIEFNYESTIMTSTLDAHRLTKLAMEVGGIACAEVVSEKIYRAYFVQNFLLSDRELLRRIGSECGIPIQNLDALFESSLFEYEVLDDEIEAEQFGIKSIPHFAVIGRRLIDGAYSFDHMERMLQDLNSEAEHRKLVQIPQLSRTSPADL